MQFVDAVKTCVIQKYADFNGRASRSEFWWFYLANIVVCWVWSFVVGMFVGGVSSLTDTNLSFGTILAYLPSLALLVPGIAVCVRRLHDIGKSGWWYLVAFICCIGGLYLLYLCAQPSDGENEYGPVPVD